MKLYTRSGLLRLFAAFSLVVLLIASREGYLIWKIVGHHQKKDFWLRELESKDSAWNEAIKKGHFPTILHAELTIIEKHIRHHKQMERGFRDAAYQPWTITDERAAEQELAEICAPYEQELEIHRRSGAIVKEMESILRQEAAKK